MRLSVIIPVLDAADHLSDCLDRVAEADERIVVDGGSRDGTPDIARAARARLLVSAPGRGTQLIAGASAATGDWLLFLHADTLLSKGWELAARTHAARSSRAAVFRLRLDDAAWQARWIEAGVRVRTSLFALPYGDQGLLISRHLYEQTGGYRPIPLMEDVDLVRRLGRGRLTVLEPPAVTSARRWREDGWGRRSLRNLATLGLWLAGLSPERAASFYSRPRSRG